MFIGKGIVAKDIEKIIDESVIPVMEYVRTVGHTKGQTEVPEVVLPKTKAEEYLEAKDRLEQKTSPVSKTYTPGKKKMTKTVSRTISKAKSENVITVDLESAAAIVVGAASNAERDNLDRMRDTLGATRRIIDEPKWVGDAEELIPFCWRNPLLTDIAHPSKFYKSVIKSEKTRAELVRPKTRAR
ncbi:MAG: hypothetical protein J1F39_02545 [Clostridiales bacterium]|nr:hypothetical protein [Clostridiales bacterium]